MPCLVRKLKVTTTEELFGLNYDVDDYTALWFKYETEFLRQRGRNYELSFTPLDIDDEDNNAN